MARPIALMHTPCSELGACLLAGVERDTRGCFLSDADRFNYFPATPMVVISWIFEGALQRVDDGTLGPVLSQLVFSGPQRHPYVSWSPGPVHALSVGFYPEAMRRLIGRPIVAFIDRSVPLAEVAPPALTQACQAVLDAGKEAPFDMLEAVFRPLWHGASAASTTPFLSDWVRSVATRATHSSAGRSLRQLQRQVRDWTGQSYRDLALFIRAEEAFLRHLEARRAGDPSLAAVAANAGYADQSHMGREIRRVTGLSPADLGRRLETDEAFWYYRLVAGELVRRG